MKNERAPSADFSPLRYLQIVWLKPRLTILSSVAPNGLVCERGGFSFALLFSARSDRQSDLMASFLLLLPPPFKLLVRPQRGRNCSSRPLLPPLPLSLHNGLPPGKLMNSEYAHMSPLIVARGPNTGVSSSSEVDGVSKG